MMSVLTKLMCMWSGSSTRLPTWLHRLDKLYFCQCPRFGRSHGKRLEIETRYVQWSIGQGELSQDAWTLTKIELPGNTKSYALGARLKKSK